MEDINNLQKLMRIQRNELIASFERASIEGQGTPQEVSDRREKSLQKFLKGYFPFPYQIAKGNVSDSYGARSQSIDTLIINPSHPHTINHEEQYSLIMAEGVDYAIELKPNLNSKIEIERALRQSQSIKKLKRKTDGLLLGRKNLTVEQKDLALQIPCIIFSEKTYSDKRILIDKIVSYYSENKTPIKEQFDIICCLDGTFVVNSSKYLHFYLDTDGFVFNNLGEDVLYYFFHFISNIPQSTPSMKENMLKHYLSRPPTSGWKAFHDLNKVLRTKA